MLRTERHAGWSIVLALIVLIAQLGAQAHAYVHLASATDPSQLHARPAPCIECNAFAPLLAAVSGVSFPAVPAVVDRATVSPRFALLMRHAAHCSAYRSRAPPIRS